MKRGVKGRRRKTLPAHYLSQRSDEAGQEDLETAKRIFPAIFALVIHTAVFLTIGFQTLVPTVGLAMLYILLPFLGYGFFRLRKREQPGLRGFVIFPLVLDLLLLLNFLICSDPRNETYAFYRHAETVTDRWGDRRQTYANTMISLEEQAYESNYGIRIFADEEQIYRSNTITYTFQTGLFGLTVMTDYRFHHRKTGDRDAPGQGGSRF
jgi:hypothetical protein